MQRTPADLFDSVGFAAIVLDGSGSILMWSAEAERMLGWSKEESIGGPPRMALSQDARHAIGSEILRELENTGRWAGIMPLRHRDGHSVTVASRASLVKDSSGQHLILSVAAEAEQVAEVERDLALRDALFGQSPLGLSIMDTNLRYVKVNQAFADMTMLPSEEYVGRTVTDLEPLRGVSKELRAIQSSVLTTGEPVVDVVLAMDTPYQRTFRSASYHRLRDRSGQILGLRCTVLDETERIHAVVRQEQARKRLAMLNEAGMRMAGMLDADLIAQELANILVPDFADFSEVLLLPEIGGREELSRGPLPSPLVLRRVAVAHAAPAADRADDRVRRILGLPEPGAPRSTGFHHTLRRLLRRDEIIRPERDTPIDQTLRSGEPKRVHGPSAYSHGHAEGLSTVDEAEWNAAALGVGSTLLVPVRAQGVPLGVLVASRLDRHAPFDEEDETCLTQLALRGAGFLDSSRLYARERDTALLLQRNLLPSHVPTAPGVGTAYRYLPGRSPGSGPGNSPGEVGGDWFDVISLSGGRTALVVGDVVGHGLRAAATMGRLRTAVRTLAALDLPPARLLQQVSELSDDLAQDPEEALLGTCVYLVYDPARESCQIARAGHPPPVLIGPDGTSRLVEAPPGAPLGAPLGWEQPYRSAEFGITPGSFVVLYSDGLVETRDADIDTGLERLCASLAGVHASVEAVCDAALAARAVSAEPDDVVLLTAELRHGAVHQV